MFHFQEYFSRAPQNLINLLNTAFPHKLITEISLIDSPFNHAFLMVEANKKEWIFLDVHPNVEGYSTYRTFVHNYNCDLYKRGTESWISEEKMGHHERTIIDPLPISHLVFTSEPSPDFGSWAPKHVIINLTDNGKSVLPPSALAPRETYVLVPLNKFEYMKASDIIDPRDCWGHLIKNSASIGDRELAILEQKSEFMKPAVRAFKEFSQYMRTHGDAAEEGPIGGQR